MTPDDDIGSGSPPKTAVVTGGSSGLGRELTESLLSAGWTVLVASRSDPWAESGGSAPRPLHIRTDLAASADIASLADAVRERFAHIHLLVNNAGILDLRAGVTPEGIERHLAVNFLSHYLLTKLICDRLGAAAPSIVANIGSAAAAHASVCNIDDFLRPAPSPRVGYERSKWALSAFSLALDRFAGQHDRPIRSILFQPPMMDTDLVRSNAGRRQLSRVALRLLRAFGAFAAPAPVAQSAVAVLSGGDAGASNYAVWCGRRKTFRPTGRPKWAADEARTRELLAASEFLAKRTGIQPAADARMRHFLSSSGIAP